MILVYILLHWDLFKCGGGADLIWSVLNKIAQRIQTFDGVCSLYLHH